MPKKVYLVLLVVSLFFCGLLFAEDGRVWYNTLRFSTGVQSFWYLKMSLVVGTGDTGFWVDISNPTQEVIPFHLQFVSQMQSVDIHNNKSCDMLDGSWFATNLSWDKLLISLQPWQTLHKRVDFQFPICSSGVFLWCAVQSSSDTLWDMNVVVGKVNFLDLVVQPSDSCSPFTIKMYPWSRPSNDYSNEWELRFYDMNRQFVSSWLLTTNTLGTWVFQKFIQAGTYYVVYKGQSHLASYLSGVVVATWSEVSVDFTTGANLYNVQNKTSSQNDGWKYQLAWDMKNTQWVYDYVINGNDISSIVYWSGLVEWGINVLNPKNLNGDTSINGADIAVVGINFQQTDPFALPSPLFVW